MKIKASEVEEGMEIVVSKRRGYVGIVEDVRPGKWSGPGTGSRHKTAITVDGRTFTVRNDFEVEVL